MFNVAILTPILQTLFTTTADELAEQAEFVQRRSPKGLCGADFLQALTFGFLKRKGAPLEDLAHPLGISRQALDQRLDCRSAPDFFKRALLQAVEHILDARPALAPLLRRFNGVFLDDCTSAWMPPSAALDFPGTGGGTGHNTTPTHQTATRQALPEAPPAPAEARMKVLLRWEILKGNVCHVGIHAGRTSDHDALALAPRLPEGSLHLADLGFCDFARLQSKTKQGVSWITKLPAQTRLSPAAGGAAGEGAPLAEQLAAWRKEGRKEVDIEGRVGNKDSARGRLVALACPADVVARRLLHLEKDARDRGRKVSERQREMCRWTVLFSNVPAGWLSARQMWRVYRLRWQIELLFKRFKSEGGLGQTSSGKRYRVESEWYAKLLGQVVRNWMQLLHGGPLWDGNPKQLGRVIADCLHHIARALRNGQGLEAALADLQEELRKIRPRAARQTRKTAARSFAQAIDVTELTD